MLPDHPDTVPAPAARLLPLIITLAALVAKGHIKSRINANNLTDGRVGGA